MVFFEDFKVQSLTKMSEMIADYGFLKKKIFGLIVDELVVPLAT